MSPPTAAHFSQIVNTPPIQFVESRSSRGEFRTPTPIELQCFQEVVPRLHHFLSVYGHFAWFRRMYELAVAASLCLLDPSVSFESRKDGRDFHYSHRTRCLKFDVTKIVILLLSSKCFLKK